MREYSKPTMVMEKIEMNQAIANCIYAFEGYITNDNQGGALSSGDMYPTPEEALEAAHDKYGSSTGFVVYPVYYVEGTIVYSEYDKRFAKGYLVDCDANGVYSDGDHWSNTQDNPAALFDPSGKVVTS